MKWPAKHRGSPQLLSPLIAEDGPATDTYLEASVPQDAGRPLQDMSGSRSSPPKRTRSMEGPDEVLIDPSSRPDKDAQSQSSSATSSRAHSREKSRSTSPGMNGTGVGHGGGITQKTQIQLTRRTPTVRSGWKLKYQDFLPSKKPDYDGDPEAEFRTLLEKANDWLSKNFDVTARTCETITWIDHDVKRLGDSEQLVICKRASENLKNYHLRGLRLWLTAHARNKNQCICYSDILPDNGDTIPGLVNKVNRNIQQNQIPGKIVTVETLSVPVINGNVDSDVTRWAECTDEDIPCAFCLRVFYDSNLSGNNATLGVKDFIPYLSEDEGYEGFDQLCDRANTWLRDQADVIVTNMQSVLVQKDEGPHSETGSACLYSMPGIHNEEEIEFFRILRVAFVNPSDDVVAETPVIYPFTYEIFCPERVPYRDQRGRERWERMKEIFSRVNSFLKSSGADVISVETVTNPMQLFPEDSAQFAILPDEMQFLLSVRLFLTDQITETDGSLTAGERVLSLSKSTKDSPNRPGPIFLKNVVNKNYKYRMIVVAVTIFTFMLIIVVISVIYSNP